MWRYLRWVLVALVAVVAIVVALPFMLPTGVYRDQIVAQAKQATGRDLKIDGNLSVSFFPAFGVELNGVHFANAAGASASDMATIEQVVVGAEFMSLLTGNVKVTHITLVKPVINLEIDKDGRGNWLFEDNGGTVAYRQGPDEGDAGDLSFKNVSIRGGTLTYRDARSGVIQSVESIDVLVELPSLDEPMTIAGVLTWNKEVLNVTAEVKNPRAIIDDNESGLSAKIVGPAMNASFGGSLDAGEGAIAGDVTFKTNSAQRLAAWFNVTLPKVQGFGPMELSGKVHATPKKIAFSDAKVALDDLRGSGNLALDTTRAKPFITGDFALDRLDVNRLSNRKTGRAAGRRAGWSDSPNDFSALNLVDAKLALSVGSAAWSDMKIGRSQIDLDLKGGVAAATFRRLELYNGSGSGTATIDASKAVPVLRVDATLNGISAAPFLWDLADLTIISGSASFVLKLTARGGSERARMQTVTGTGQMRFNNGALRGVDLAQIAHNITSAVVGNALGPKASTPFSSLSGTFIVREGVAANRNLTLLNPRVRLDGSGVVNVGARTLNYRVEPKPLSGGRRMPNLGVPVRIFGSWENPQYEPEVGGVVNAAINTVLNTPGDALDTVGGLLPSVGDDKDDKKGKKKKKPKNPIDALGDFLGGN